MPWLFYHFRTCRRLFVPKSRDMMISWAVIGYLTWLAQYYGPAHIIIQAQREDKVRDLVSGIDVPGYVRCLYEQQESWMQALHPTTRPSKHMAGDVFTWVNGSKIQGIPAGSAQIRQYHPRCIFFDEAAFMDDWLGSYQAADPVATQIISVSSAAPSAFGDTCLRLMEEGREITSADFEDLRMR
jgi:hypothetical protein